MDDYFDRVEAQLAGLVARGAHRSPRAKVTGWAAGAASTAAALLTSALLVVTVAAVILSSGSARRVGGSTLTPDPGGIAPVLLHKFKILRRPLNAGDRLPEAFLRPARSDPLHLGLLPALARGTATAGGAVHAWLVPGARGYCIDAEATTADVPGRLSPPLCGPLPRSVNPLEGGAFVFGRPARGGLSIGLVSDRVRALELRPRRGAARAVPLSEGFYVTRYLPGDRLIAITAAGHSALSPFVPPSRQPAKAVPSSTRITLQPPNGRRVPGSAIGIVKLLEQGGNTTVSISARGLKPNTRRDSYAVWLYRSPADSRLLGFVTPGVGANGRASTAGALPRNAAHYSRILVTLETRAAPRAPGRIALEGTLASR